MEFATNSVKNKLSNPHRCRKRSPYSRRNNKGASIICLCLGSWSSERGTFWNDCGGMENCKSKKRRKYAWPRYFGATRSFVKHGEHKRFVNSPRIISEREINSAQQYSYYSDEVSGGGFPAKAVVSHEIENENKPTGEAKLRRAEVNNDRNASEVIHGRFFHIPTTATSNELKRAPSQF